MHLLKRMLIPILNILGQGRDVPPPPPLTGSLLLTESSLFLITEGGDFLTTET